LKDDVGIEEGSQDESLQRLIPLISLACCWNGFQLNRIIQCMVDQWTFLSRFASFSGNIGLGSETFGSVVYHGNDGNVETGPGNVGNKS